MSTMVFVGPTLPAAECKMYLPSATLAGPVACGDVLRATKRGFSTIILIDGFFDQRPPVWHKEILWALSQGCRVLGGASMGAIRAAELHIFGMEGVGLIFEALRCGTLTRDDEVAIAHASEAEGYRALSDALVNIRVTLRKAAAEGILTLEAARALCALAENLYYPQRTYAAIIARAQEMPALAADALSLRDWLRASADNAIDQKRRDAREVLDRVRILQESPRVAPAFEFATTEAWIEFVRAQA